MDDEQEVFKLWRMRKTILELCNDRGYLVTSDELDQTLEQFKEIFGDKPSLGQPSRGKLVVLVSHKENPDDQMYVFFPDDPKVGLSTIKSYVGMMKDQGIKHAILVVSQGISPIAKRAIAELQTECTFEPFFDAELMINITNHFVSTLALIHWVDQPHLEKKL